MFKRLVTLLLGIGLIGLGALFFLAPEQAYLVQLLKRCWPLFLVLAGLVRFAGFLLDRHPRSPVGSLLLTALGCILLAISLRGESSLTDILGRYWFWLLLAYMLGRILRQYLHRHEDGRTVAALSPSAVFVMLLITGTGLSANYLSKHRDLFSGLQLRVGNFGNVGNYVFGNPIQVDDEPLQTFKLAPNAQLTIDPLNGELEIRTSNVQQATAKLTKHIRATNEEHARQTAQNIHLQINPTDPSGAHVRLGVTAREVTEAFTVSLRIELPSQQAVNVEVNETTGAVTVTGLRGDLAIRNAGRTVVTRNTGRVTLEGMRGAVQLAQIEGEVALNDLRNGAELSGIQGAVVLSARGGSYSLNNITGPVRASLAGGRLSLRSIQPPSVFTAQERLVTLEEIRDARLTLEEIKGNVLISATRSRVETEALTGDLQLTTTSEPVKLSRHLGNLRVSAENGSISVRDLKGAAQLETTEDITVQNFAGPLSVKTRRGRINLSQNAELAGDLIVQNEYGQTRLSLPKDISFRLDAITTSGRLRARGFDDIELQRNQRTLTANHQADGNSPLISLRSTKGNIELQASGLALASNDEP
jgi:DUF4097 and DUF4098 domain-containing protein YvlB